MSLSYRINSVGALSLFFISLFCILLIYISLVLFASFIVKKKKNNIMTRNLMTNSIWLRSAVIILCYTPSPNICQNLIRGHVLMNSWSANENTAEKILAALCTLFLLVYYICKALRWVDLRKICTVKRVINGTSI